MAKAKFPKALKSNQINSANSVWLGKYKMATKHVDSYYSTIANFFMFHEYQNKPFDTFTQLDIEKYIEVMLENYYKEDSVNSLIGALSGFRNFLTENESSAFSKDFLSQINHLRFDNVSPSDAFALSVDQIWHIREYNKQNIRDEYIFEIYFQLGIMKKELTVCHPQNSNSELSCFQKNGVAIRYNAKIAQLLDKLPNIKIEFTPETANPYLLKVTKYLRQKSVYYKDRLLNYSDLIKSHKKYVVECPNCSELTENVSKNWVLAKRAFEPDYRLVCARCKGLPNGN